MESPNLVKPYQCWSIDFVVDQMVNWRKFRVLTLDRNAWLLGLDNRLMESIDVVRIIEDVK